MEGRIDLSALDRSRLLQSGSLGGLGPPYSGAESSHSSSLNRYSAGSAAGAPMVSQADMARAGSPTALQQYSGRFLPTTGPRPPGGAGYAMMAGYLANTGGHIPDSLKHLMPEFQQYWSSAMHSEGYARYLLNSMYYPYLSYLPSTATESLALFAQNSASAAQVQAAIQAQANQHRIYDLQKEAMFSQGSLSHGYYPQTHGFNPGSQQEATNLSLPNSNKLKSDVGRESDTREYDTKRETDNAKFDAERRGYVFDSDYEKVHEKDKSKDKILEGSERTRGLYSKTDDRDKVKSSKKTNRGNSTQNVSIDATHHSSCSKSDMTLKMCSPKSTDSYTKCSKALDRKSNEEKERHIRENDRKVTCSASPQRHSRLVSPDRRSSKAYSPGSNLMSSPVSNIMSSPVSNIMSSPVSNIISATFSPGDNKFNIVPCVQEMPENLCVKDRQRNKESESIKETSDCEKTKAVSSGIKTQSTVTGTTITVTSTLNVCTVDTSSETKGRTGDIDATNDLHSPSSMERSQISPSLTHSPTMTTYSLPYYHNLYSRSQNCPQQGKRVHAVTYVPEIGTISSPIAGAPSIIDVVDNNKSDTKQRENIVKNSENCRESEECKSTITKGGKRISPPEHIVEDSNESDDINVCDNECDGSKVERNEENNSKESDTANNKDVSVCKTCEGDLCKCEHNSIDTLHREANGSNSAFKYKTSSNLSQSCITKSEGSQTVSGDKVKVTTDKLSVISESEHSITEEGCQKEAQDMRRKMMNDTIESIKSNDSFQSKEGSSPCDMNHNSKTKLHSPASAKVKPDDASAKSTIAVKTISTVKTVSNVPKQTEEQSIKLLPKSEFRHSDQSMGIKPLTTRATVLTSDISRADTTGPKNALSVSNVNVKTVLTSAVKTVDSQILKSTMSKQSDGQPSVSGIPVGIAVARQRNIAPKVTTDRESRKGIDEARSKGSTPDIKQVRPLKIIRPSTTKGSTPTSIEKRNELPANLIVTGGSATASGVFWNDDPTSRQLAAQYMQNGSPITPSSWYGQTPYPFPQSVTTPTSDGNTSNQLPLTIPPGYKLAQDSLTGQILFIPAGADIYDNSPVYSGFQIGSQLHPSSAFGASGLTSQHQTGSLPTTPTFISGQTSLGERPTNLEFAIPQYQHVFNASVLPGTDVVLKDDKTGSSVQSSGAAPAIVNPTVRIASCRNSTSGPAKADQLTDKDKLTTLTKAAVAPEIGVTQQCSYNFPAAALPMPFVFNSSIIPATSITGSVTEIIHPKQDSNVQSRGTSPMLPATDSSNEECDEYGMQAEVKSIDKIDEENSRDICDNDSVPDNSETDVKPEAKKEETDHQNETNAEKHIKTDNGVYEEMLDTTDEKSGEKHCVEITDAICKESKTSVKDQPDSPHKTENVNSDDAKADLVKAVKRGRKQLKLDFANKTDRNIFTDITEYNPFTDPQVLQAADGLELLSALAEKSSLCSAFQTATPAPKEPGCNTSTTQREDIFNFKSDSPKTVQKENDEFKFGVKKDTKQPDEQLQLAQLSPAHSHTVASASKQEKHRPRIKCGHAFLPKLKEDTHVEAPKRVTTFCGITIPEDDEVMDSIELEMKLRLAELQRRYKEKQKELAKLTPKRDKDSDKEKDVDKNKYSSEKSLDPKRGPGRPKKRPSDPGTGPEANGDYTSPKSKLHKRDSKEKFLGSSPATNGTGGSSGPTKKKKMAEMIVDRVFRKSGSSFKIPLSKKVSLIAPARIEFPSNTSVVDRNEQVRHNKSLDFGKLIKRSRLSQLNGKDRSFVGGLWNKEEKKKHLLFGTHGVKLKKRKKPKDFSVENGLGLLAEYATKSRDDIEKKKRKAEETPGSSSPDSPNKKRKPGRPKKCDVIRPGVTETIVAKQSKHMDYFRLQTEEPKKERKITLEGKTPLKPLYLDEWNVRRSERIFLSDPSPQTSPNPISPGINGKQEDNVNGQDKDARADYKPKSDKQKKSTSIGLSQKLKKKYSTGFSQQRAREKTTELLKASRDRLTMKRQENKKKLLSDSSKRRLSSESSDTDDIPLISFKPRPKTPDPPKCALDKDTLRDGKRILVFEDGLFHEGELKAIRPPDVYGAILANERKTRPHYFSQEEILKDAIMDVKATCPKQLKEGTRICAYWSQQFSCLYPGTISKGSPNPSTANNNLFNVEFDDGDTGKIPLDHIRIIPQDFPLVEYDPNPLLLLTKRRRTVSVSESSEPRKSHSEPSPATPDGKKRGPGRPPKTVRMLSTVSMGDEDVFVSEEKRVQDSKKEKQSEPTPAIQTEDSGDTKQEPLTVLRELWTWSGSSTKRPGLKGKAKKEYYKTVIRGRESISVGECAVFLSTGRPNLPYVGRIESFWEAWGGQMVVKVKWFYHPEETKGGKRLQNMKGALFRSDHEDENDCQTISHKCEVISYADYKRRKEVISLDDDNNVYYLAGSYQPTIGHIKFEPGVMVT